MHWSFECLLSVEDWLWGYVGFPALLLVGFYLTWRSRLMQIRRFPWVCKTFASFMRGRVRSQIEGGVHPLSAFFACVGGCIGIGNVVAITTAIQLGGPGALFWIWITAIVGSIVKYSEVFLGMKYRIKAGDGYRGGPMFFIQQAFGQKWLVGIFCVLLSLYGVEVYQFDVVVASVAGFGMAKEWVVVILLAMVLLAETGGVKRVGAICSTIIPTFVVLYLGMGLYVVAANIGEMPAVIASVFRHAFTAHAAVGAFAGSGLLLTISQGVRRSAYSSDFGVGYASIIHSESSEQVPQRQASLTLAEVFLDIFVICTMSVVMVLVTGGWKEGEGTVHLVENVLGRYFPYMDVFMPFFLFLLGYTTIITYFVAGMRTAMFLSPKWGRVVYTTYAVVAFWVFSYVEVLQANAVMSIVLALLLILNLAAIVRLHKEINYEFESSPGSD